MHKIEENNLLELCVAALRVCINHKGNPYQPELPLCHQKFLGTNVRSEEQSSSDWVKTLSLNISEIEKFSDDLFVNPICKTKIWELWQGLDGELIFYPPLESPPRVIVIDQDFCHGKILLQASKPQDTRIYPLLYIDMIIYSNWLATTGDLILHASGISYKGEGFAFAGDSGKGKSTLVGDIADQPGVTILGEDQVILRKINGRYWIFGTPWHINPQRCSPEGVPLKKLFFLDREAGQVLTTMSTAEMISAIMRSAFVPYYRPVEVDNILQNLMGLSEQVACLTLAYRRGSDVLSDIIQNNN